MEFCCAKKLGVENQFFPSRLVATSGWEGQGGVCVCSGRGGTPPVLKSGGKKKKSAKNANFSQVKCEEKCFLEKESGLFSGWKEVPAEVVR